ncbi:hypothetical protein BDZ91DRAFT_741417 [Kalaharituber pfeilii]|nr:hypothetical protein BDZ91DRAFT_741417 [Kalaharituber pfeilii]
MSGLEFVGLALAVPGIIDLCLKYGQVLVDKVELYRHSDAQLNEKQLRISDHWIKIKTELKFVNSVSSRLAPDVLDHFSRLLQQLLGKIEAAIRLLDSLYAKSDSWRNKVKLAMTGFTGVKKVIEELDEWQGCFSNYLMLVTLVGDNAIDLKLSESQQTEGSQALDRIQRIRTALSTPVSKRLALTATEDPAYSQRTLLRDSGDEILTTPSFIVEYRSISFPTTSIPVEEQAKHLADFRIDIFNLAHVLAASDPAAMNIPKCHGFIYNSDKHRFEMFYQIPTLYGPKTVPRTLRSILTAKENKLGAFHSINDRFRLATQLAQAVLYVHTAKLVHKNIRPETILIMEPSPDAEKKTRYPYSIGTPVLFGFSKVREIQAESERTGDQDWEKNIYRHPQRQGLHPDDKYNILHDVYSLGVCLLEISLWTSFVFWDPVAGEYRNNGDACSIFEKGGSGNGSAGQKPKLKPPKEIQKSFIRKAQQAIPRIMGERFSRIVVSCLTCLEGGLGNVEENLGDENRILLGVAYVDRVLTMLDEISV